MRPHIRCGDIVRHVPTGDEFMVAYADYESGLVVPAVRDGTFLLNECETAHPASDDLHRRVVAMWRDSPFNQNDPRRAHVLRLYGTEAGS